MMEDRVLKIIAEQSRRPVEKIDKEDVLMEDLGLDPFDMEELRLKLEEAFGVQISDEVLEQHFIEVNDVIEFVKKEAK